MLKVFTGYGPSAARQRSLVLDTFRGVDMTSGAASVDPKRSPAAPNMMPDANGFPVKRPGYWLRYTLPGGRINGAHHRKTPSFDKWMIHAGEYLYAGEDGTVIIGGMQNAPSCSVQLGEKVLFWDGGAYRVWMDDPGGDGAAFMRAAEMATVPIVTINRSPSREGASTSYQPINLLTGKRTDSFLADGEATVYYLSAARALANSTVQVAIRNNAEPYDWEVISSGYTANADDATVTFAQAPEAPVPVGEDNVRITYEVENSENLATINGCRFGILYGVAGGMDRVFMSGNPAEPNVDWWSEFDDPFYIGDVFYADLGSSSSPIMGYSVLNEKLVTHKREEENDRNAFVRLGELEEDGDAFFRIVNVIQGEGAANGRSNATLSSEPVFLSDRGVFALTANDLTGERYNQKRSFYIDGALKDADLSEACATMWGRFYVLAAGGSLYLLDTDQKSYESKAGTSVYQYECYCWPGIDATALWTEGETLLWGDAEGHVFEFFAGDGRSDHYRDWVEGCPTKAQLEASMAELINTAEPSPEQRQQLEAYMEMGRPVEAWWSTPLLPLAGYGDAKNILDAWVTGHPYSHTGGDIYYASDRYDDRLERSYSISVWDWEDTDFGDFSFSSTLRPEAVRCGRKSYGIEMAQLKIANTDISQPFGIYALQINYEVAGRTKC